MKKASALTAALSGKQSESVSATSDDAAKHTESFSFPCLDRNGKQTAYGLDDVTAELGKSSLKDQVIAGSAPTAVVLPNGSIAVSLQQSEAGHACAQYKETTFPIFQADYELNPYRRRGGEERVPTPQASEVGVHTTAHQ